MRAVLCNSFDGPEALSLGNIPEPIPGPGEVTIRVSAAALNFFDTLVIRGKYQFRPDLPFSPGGEVAGRILQLGPGVEDFAEGQRVMARLQWNGCREVALAKATDIIPLPDAVADASAAGLTITYGTAMHGLKDRAALRSGETVAVLGASGGAGLAAVEIAKLMGARVIAAASSSEKLELCRKHGADELFDYAANDLKEGLKALTGGRGADVIYDCVGGPYAEAALRATAWAGRYLVIGFAGGDIPKIPLNLTLLKGCSIIGVFFGRFAELYPERHRANMEEVLRWCAEGKLTPYIHAIFPLEETASALRLIDERKASGKIIIKP